MTYPKINHLAPQFSLPDQTGTMHELSSYKNSWVLLYFYPKDDTPGCTAEACTIRDSYSDFKKKNIFVFGVSADSVKSHKKFVEKFSLPFVLLSDSEKKVVEAYGVWQKKKFMGREYFGIARTSFLINPAGEIAKVYEGVKPADHAAEVLHDVDTLSKKDVHN